MYMFMQSVNDLILELFRKNKLKEKSQVFYKTRVEKFFNEYMGREINKSKPLNAITYYDIDTYLNGLQNSPSDKLNNYNALKRFFSFTYEKGVTGDIMSQVIKPKVEKKVPEILDDNRYNKLVNYILNDSVVLSERLILGLFIYTGLSRQYIAAIQNNHFVYERGLYFLSIWKDEEEIKLPLKAELQLLIKEYCLSLAPDEKFNKLINMDENSVSTYVSNLVKKATGRKCTPTILSNTFISKALSNGNYIWEVSRLTLENVSTIEKHVNNNENLVHRQTSILNSF